MTDELVPTLSPEQLAEVLEVIKRVDSVELKLSVPDGDRRSVVAALDLDPLEAQIRQVAFFATPDLANDVFHGRQAQRKLFTKDQRAFFAQHAPDGVELDDLVMLGPINLLKL